MGTPRRFLALVTASALGVGTAMGLGITPAAAALGAPAGLTTSGQACAGEAPGPYLSPVMLNSARAVVLQGTVAGAPDDAELEADFQVWDVAAPEQRQQWLRDVAEEDDSVYVQLEDDAKQLDGVTYAWRVRVLDGATATPWSETCHFTIDRTRGEAPQVVSAQYPGGSWDGASGAIGVPGTFRFKPVTGDVASYRYRFYSAELAEHHDWSAIELAEVGDEATVDWTPATAGHHSVTVAAIDRAGNWSEEAVHVFYVRETRPAIWSADYPESGANLDFNVGVPGAFELHSNVADTASFAWRIDADGPSGSVPADAEGEATAMIAPARAGRQTLYVQIVTRNGTKHPARAYEFLVDNGPKLTGDVDKGVIIGSSLTFHLEPRTANVDAYLYWPSEQPDKKVTVPARPDGTADLVWTATETDVGGLRIQSRSKDGTLSEPRWTSVSVDGAEPTVTRSGGGDFGTPATFTARTRMANVADYVVTLNRVKSTEQVLRPAADGSVNFTYTPKDAGYNYVTVVARNAAGVQTVEGGESWSVSDAPHVTSAEFPAMGTGRLAPGTFTFSARRPGTTAYEYSLNFGSYRSIPVRADGTAVLDWTPPSARVYYLTVRSVSGTTRSLTTQHNFEVEEAVATVTSLSPSSVSRGGVRTVTIAGTGLHTRDVVEVTPVSGPKLTATVRTVSADRKTMTAEVDVTSAALGRAALTLRPYGGTRPAVLADALTITAPPVLAVVQRPVVTGTATVGSSLKATAGTWNPAATTYRYQWSANGVAVQGATGATLTVPASLLGKRLTVTVTAERAGHTSAKSSSVATAAVGKGKAPRATRAPKVTGTARVGRTVKVDTGAWSARVDSYRFEWRVAGKLVRGATGRSLKLTASLKSKKVTVTVIARRTGYTDGRATSAAVTVRR